MSHPKTLFECDAIKVEVDSQLGLLLAVWLRQPTSSEFRARILLITEYALEKNISYALFDVRKRGYMEFGDQNWLIKVITPQFQGKLKKLAYLTTLANLDMLDTIRVQDAVSASPSQEAPFQIEHFLEKQLALEWLFE